MDVSTDEEYAYKVHLGNRGGYESDSSIEGDTDFDEFYYANKPPPLSLEDYNSVVIQPFTLVRSKKPVQFISTKLKNKPSHFGEVKNRKEKKSKTNIYKKEVTKAVSIQNLQNNRKTERSIIYGTDKENTSKNSILNEKQRKCLTIIINGNKSDQSKNILTKSEVSVAKQSKASTHLSTDLAPIKMPMLGLLVPKLEQDSTNKKSRQLHKQKKSVSLQGNNVLNRKQPSIQSIKAEQNIAQTTDKIKSSNSTETADNNNTQRKTAKSKKTFVQKPANQQLMKEDDKNANVNLKSTPEIGGSSVPTRKKRVHRKSMGQSEDNTNNRSKNKEKRKNGNFSITNSKASLAEWPLLK